MYCVWKRVSTRPGWRACEYAAESKDRVSRQDGMGGVHTKGRDKMRLVPQSIWIARDGDGSYYAYTSKPEWDGDCEEFGFQDSHTAGDSMLANLCTEQLEEWLSPISLDNGDVVQLNLEFVL